MAGERQRGGGRRDMTDFAEDGRRGHLSRRIIKVAEQRAPDARGENRYRLLFDEAADGIWLTDRRGRFVDANSAACRMLGYAREQLLALSLDDVLRPGDYHLRLAGLARRFTEGQQVTEVWDVRKADGNYLSVELSQTFTRDGLWAIGRDISARQRVFADREIQLQREHDFAAALQRNLLPQQLPVPEQLDLVARYEPAGHMLKIGGDWYDVIVVDKNRVAVAVGDVVGNGASAAATMGQLRSAARVLLLEGRGPAQTLRALDHFAAMTRDAQCATVFCAVIDLVAGSVRYSSAGHPPAVLDSGVDGFQLLENAQSLPLAVVSHANRRESETPMPDGSTLLLYTDGLVERRGQSIDVGISHAASLIGQNRHLPSAQLADLLVEQLTQSSRDDDVAFLLCRRPAAPLSLQLAARKDELAQQRAVLRDWLARAGVESPDAEELVHAVGEVVTNAAEHGSGFDGTSRVTLTGERYADGVHITVSDDGRWIEPSAHSARGRGLLIARAFVDRLEISTSRTGTTVHLTKEAKER